jgi:hypothetical protein
MKSVTITHPTCGDSAHRNGWPGPARRRAAGPGPRRRTPCGPGRRVPRGRIRRFPRAARIALVRGARITRAGSGFRRPQRVRRWTEGWWGRSAGPSAAPDHCACVRSRGRRKSARPADPAAAPGRRWPELAGRVRDVLSGSERPRPGCPADIATGACVWPWTRLRASSASCRGSRTPVTSGLGGEHLGADFVTKSWKRTAWTRVVLQGTYAYPFARNAQRMSPEELLINA